MYVCDCCVVLFVIRCYLVWLWYGCILLLLFGFVFGGVPSFVAYFALLFAGFFLVGKCFVVLF